MIMGFFSTVFSTRKTMQSTPSCEQIHIISPDELKQLQNCFLAMLKDLDEVCKKHDICYMAAGGTALGAIRHKGFIPWDDDADIIMPRADLEKFKKIFSSEMGDRYEMTSPNSDFQLESMISAIYLKNTYKAPFLTYNAPFPKGVHIDIFAIETVPENTIKRLLKGYIAMGIQYIAVSSILYRYMNKEKRDFFCQTSAGRINYLIRMTVGKLFSFKSYEKWGNLFDRFVRGPKESNLWAVPTDIKHYFGHIMPKSVYYPPRLAAFEDMQIPVPNDTDEYLKNQYGDYMTIPPEEDRETHYSIGFSLDLTKDGGAENLPDREGFHG